MDTSISHVARSISKKEAESKEYITIVNCTSKLNIALRSDDEIVHFLDREGFIKHKIYNRIKDPISLLSDDDKAGLLVTGIKDKVELNPKNYHTFVDYLRQNRRMYRDIVDILDDEYYT